MENNTKKMKKHRCQNWLDDEKTLLLNLVQRYVKYIENKNTDTSTNIKKRQTWQKICDSFNELACRQGPPRTVPQLKTQWSIIKMKMKKILTQERKSMMKAGDRQTLVGSVDDSILSWLPNKFDVDTNSSESEPKIMIPPDDTNSNEEMASQHEEQNQNDIKSFDDRVVNVEVKRETQHVRKSPDNVLINNDEEEKTSPIKRKKLSIEERKEPTPEEAADLMTTLVNFDKKLKSNLHEMQMKNEHLKHEILLIKLEYWKKKAAAIDGKNPEMDHNVTSD